MKWFWDTYCPDEATRSDPQASPMRGDLAGLPPALVVTAEFDPLRDEGMAYAQALTAAGNSASGVCYDGLVHDFCGTAAIFDCSRQAFAEICDTLRNQLN
jgi:acetyl esterase